LNIPDAIKHCLQELVLTLVNSYTLILQAPWPHVALLAAATAEAGKLLVPRLPVYPSYIHNSSTWLDPVVLKRVLASANSLGYARAERWSPGIPVDTGFAFAEPITSSQTSCSKVDPELTQAVSASITEHMGQHSKTLVGIDGTISQPRHLDRGNGLTIVSFFIATDVPVLLQALE
jgi:hypothetical protein